MADSIIMIIMIDIDNTPVGPINRWRAKDYTESLDYIVDEFCQLISEDQKNALVTMVRSMKRHISSQFDVMDIRLSGG